MPYVWVIVGGIAAWLVSRALSKTPDTKVIRTPDGPVLISRQLEVPDGDAASALSAIASGLTPYGLRPHKPLTAIQASRLLKAIEKRRPNVSRYSQRTGPRTDTQPPSATAQVSRPKAILLAPQVDNNIRSAAGFYSPELVYEFQIRVGLEGTGRYDGQTKGAVEYYTRGDAPEPLFPPLNTIPYEEPI